MTNWDAVERSNYEQRVLTPQNWVRLADNLLKSARLLKPHAQRAWKSMERHIRDRNHSPSLDHYTATYLMLISYALENLLKAALVAQERTALMSDPRFCRDGQLPKELRGHSLVHFVSRLKIQLDPASYEALLRLERSAVWAGRYPVALAYREHANSKKDRGTTYNVGYIAAADLTSLPTLVSHIRSQLKLGLLPSEFRAKRLKKARSRRVPRA